MEKTTTKDIHPRHQDNKGAFALILTELKSCVANYYNSICFKDFSRFAGNFECG